MNIDLSLQSKDEERASVPEDVSKVVNTIAEQSLNSKNEHTNTLEWPFKYASIPTQLSVSLDKYKTLKSGAVHALTNDTALKLVHTEDEARKVFENYEIVYKSGYLEKQGGLIKNWKIRMFRLYLVPPSFEYYSDTNTSVIPEVDQFDLLIQPDQLHIVCEAKTNKKREISSSKSDPIRRVPLTSATLIERDTTDLFAFKVSTKERVWRFKATSKGNLESWLDAFNYCKTFRVKEIASDHIVLHRVLFVVDCCFSFASRPYQGETFIHEIDVLFLLDKLTTLRKLVEHLFRKYQGIEGIYDFSKEAKDIIRSVEHLVIKLHDRYILHGHIEAFRNHANAVSAILQDTDSLSVDLTDFEMAVDSWRRALTHVQALLGPSQRLLPDQLNDASYSQEITQFHTEYRMLLPRIQTMMGRHSKRLSVTVSDLFSY